MPKNIIPGETKAERKARKAKEKQAKLIKDSKNKNYIACLKWGDKYSAEYVNKLYKQTQKFCTIDHEFVCFTENKSGLDPNIKTFGLPKLQAQGWWYKPMFLGGDLPIRGTLLFVDLDIIIFKNIDKLFEYEPGEFVICRDFNRSIRQRWDRMNSSVFRIPIGKYDDKWRRFYNNTGGEMGRHRGDQDWMFANIKDHKFWPDEWIMSYKWEMGVHVRKPEFGQRAHIIEGRTEIVKSLTVQDGKKIWTTEYKKPKITEHTCVAVFHGRPNPEQCLDDPLVAENWRL